MDIVKRLWAHCRQKLVLAAGIVVAAGCSSSEPQSCDDVAAVDSVLYESGMAVADTMGARLVFEEYVALVRASGDRFPDGAENWVLEGVSASPWDVAPWVVSYIPEPGDPFARQVHVDRAGRVVRLVIAVHPPCGAFLIGPA